MLSIMKHVRRKKLTQLTLSSIAKSIVLGSLLGDGCLRIYKGYKNAKFSIRHSNPQKEYLEWKVQKLRENEITGTISEAKPDGFSLEKKWIFQSHVKTELTQIYDLTHKIREKKLSIQRRWLNHLTPLALAIWWFDDGSLICGRRRGVFCTDGFDQKSCLLLQAYLKSVCDVSVTVKPIYRKALNKSYYRLWLSTSQLQKLLRIILPEVPLVWDIFEKKMIIRYKNPDLQQRWISELIEHLSVLENSRKYWIIQKLRERYSPILI